MAVQLREAGFVALSWLLQPDVPEPDFSNRTGGLIGFRRSTTGTFTLSQFGHEVGPVAQRIVLAYALRLASREQIAERYCLSVRHTTSIIAGDALGHFTAPIRRMLTALDICEERIYRGDSRERRQQVQRAISRLENCDPGIALSADIRLVASDLLGAGWWLQESQA